MSILINIYSRLLADTSQLLRIPLGLPDSLTVNWVLIEGPKLDKQLLQYIEGNREVPVFPDWLLPIWDLFILNKNIEALRCLRTLLVFGYKTEHEPTKNQLLTAQLGFEETNSNVGSWNHHFNSADIKPLIFREARRLIGLVLSRTDLRDIYPSHGPGAVYPPKAPVNKGNHTIYTPIEEYYPYDQYYCCVHESGYDNLISPRKSIDEIVCKLVAVPKDSRGPRLICVHPSEAIWIQQGQRRAIERSITNHPMTRGRINFTDQTVNGNLALTSSLSRSFTTIDLKEASDRVGSRLVEYLFGYYSKLIGCSRATRCIMLDGRSVELNMWAPMGNCLTFPIESLVFWSLVHAGIRLRYGVSCDDVYVFGDDIVIPTSYYDGAIYGLVQAGLIPNFDKTFRKGFFRESCGVDAYHGINVTPYRMKKKDITSYPDAESLCDLAKRLRRGGYSHTSAFIYSSISRRFGRLSLTNDPDCQGILEYMEADFGKILMYEPRVIYDSDLHAFCVPFQRVVRDIDLKTPHAWWHVQESLLRLRGFSSGEYSDRGLEYPYPRGERLSRGLSYLKLD